MDILFDVPVRQLLASKSSYDVLSELCTMLVIADEGSEVPLHKVGLLISHGLTRDGSRGDVNVMAARACALLLDKFPTDILRLRGRGLHALQDSLRHLFALLSPQPTLRFELTTARDLTEELLRCLTLGNDAGSWLHELLPSVDVQLQFCEQVVGVSGWVSGRALRHCIALARSTTAVGAVHGSRVKLRMTALFRRQLDALVVQNMDYEWDELLRTVTEGVLTLRYWGAPAREQSDPTAAARALRTTKTADTEGEPKGATASGGRQGRRKRRRSATRVTEEGKAGSAHKTSAVAVTTPCDAPTSIPVEELYLQICTRACELSVAETRKALVLACTNAVVTAAAMPHRTAQATRRRLVCILQRLLHESAQMVNGLSNPFTRRADCPSDLTEDEDEDATKVYTNLQWIVPAVPWSALVLLAQLCGAAVPMTHDHLWTWRAEAETYYRYPKADRTALTHAFEHGVCEVRLRNETHVVNLEHMTDTNCRTRGVARVQFQPVPFVSHYHATQPLQADMTIAATLVADYDTPSNAAEESMPGVTTAGLRRVLRSVSFGCTPVARLAKVVYLHVICSGAPSDSEEVRAAFRNVLAQQSTRTLEQVAEQLVRRDAGWAHVLVQSGVVDHLSAVATAADMPPNTTPMVSARRRRRLQSPPTMARTSPPTGTSPRATPMVSSRRPRCSPVVQMIRQAESALSTAAAPSLPPLTLPRQNTGLALCEQLAQAASAHGGTELLPWIEYATGDAAATSSGTPAWTAMEVDKVSEWLTHAASSATLATLQGAIITFTLRMLQKVSTEGRAQDLLTILAKREPGMITICQPKPPSSEGTTKDSEAAPSLLLCCPRGHALTVHFSTNWLCNLCGQHTAFAAWGCRSCDYDVCYRCGEVLLRRLCVSDTAVAGHVRRAWSELQTRHTTLLEDATSTAAPRVAASAALDGVLFTPSLVLSAVVPSPVLQYEELHFGSPQGVCLCGLPCPRACVTTLPSESVAEAAMSSPLPRLRRDEDDENNVSREARRLLRVLITPFTSSLASDADVRHALTEAVESCGAAIFFAGVTGLPWRLRLLLTALSPSLPLALKCDVAAFVTVQCRRYGLHAIQEADLLLRGVVVGDVEDVGLSVKISVTRDNMIATLDTLYTTFLRGVSVGGKVEFVFAGEEGTGNGPTQELYGVLSRHFRDELPKLWYARDEGEAGHGGQRVTLAFPSCETVYWKEFYVLGAACARAFVDHYLMEVDILPQVWLMLRELGEWGDDEKVFSAAYAADDVAGLMGSTAWHVLAALEPTLVQSYRTLLQADEAELAAMAIEDNSGDESFVTRSTVVGFVARAMGRRLAIGCQNIRALALGMMNFVDLNAFWFFSPEELSRVFFGIDADECGSPRRLFTADELRTVVVEAHGYQSGSSVVSQFVTIVGDELTRRQQEYFLEFLTGTSRLPPGGLAGLGRKITVVKKEMEDSNETTLPSCNTCFFYFKLPPYSQPGTMKQRLILAITEGRRNFSLS